MSLVEFEASPHVDRKADKNCSLEQFWGEKLIFDNLVVDLPQDLFESSFIGFVDRDASAIDASTETGFKPSFVICPKQLGWQAYNKVKSLILAQNERWRRGLGMQVVRVGVAIQRQVAKGRVTRRYLPSGRGYRGITASNTR